jgi:hypothetical protein
MPDLRGAAAAKRALDQSRAAAMELVRGMGADRTRELLEQSARALETKIAAVLPALGENTFTVVQLRATLAHVRSVLVQVTLPRLRDVVVDATESAGRAGAQHTVDYLVAADRAFRGQGEQPLPLRQAGMLHEGVSGARASVLRRLASEPAPKGRHHRGRQRARVGILSRYGIETVGAFEQELRVGLVAKKSWTEMREAITKRSPFLQGKPAHWAHRIVRTEIMSAHGAAAHHSIQRANQDLGGGMLKVLSETFDDRTAADSWADHAQVRRPDEDFENWYGPFPYPAGRPNDRAVVVPHMQRWPLPEYLQQKTDEEVEEAWRAEGHKKPCPERPLMSTVDGFGEA